MKIYKILTLCLCVSTWACDEPPPPPPPPLTGPVLPIDTPTVIPAELGEGSGHWTAAQRGIALDEEDLIVIPRLLDEINNEFALLVVNRPLLTLETADECFTEEKAIPLHPKAQVSKVINELSNVDVSFDQVAVNVDLLYPNRKLLYHLCLDNSGLQKISFFLPEHWEQTITAFEDLASLDQVKYITVGLEMNKYYHLKIADEQQRDWDYANFILFYREVYDAIKAVNPEVQVAPGISWSTLMVNTRDRVAQELELDLEDPTESLIAFELALSRTVWPLLVDEEGEVKADYIGVSFIPQSAIAPFNNRPDPEDLTEVRAYYQNLPLLGAPPELVDRPLPLAFAQMDWLSPNNASSGSKGPFLKTLKESVSHVDPLWVAWRRFSDLPTKPEVSSRCKIFTGDLRKYPTDYCFSGLTNPSGVTRDVWDELVVNP